jgi:hypothetical protein
MSIRISFGSYWFELDLFESLMVGAYLYLQIEYGHNSTNNLINLRKDHKGNIYFKWRGRKTVALKKVEQA